MKQLRPLVIAIAFCLALPRPSHGTGDIGNSNPTGVNGEYNGSVTTAGSYDPYTGNAKRSVTDLSVVGGVGAYPLEWTRILNAQW